MQKLRCIAVDDEMPSLKVIEHYVDKNDALTLAAKFRNPLEAAEWLKVNPCDILFLDILMPHQNGITMFKNLVKQPITIFITAHSEYAADAFDLDAADYLRKPFSYERFLKAIDKAKNYLNLDSQIKSELIQGGMNEGFLSFKTDGKHVKVLFSEIIYIEAFQEYIKVYTDRGRFITYDRMKNIETRLPVDKFMRVHRSYIISLSRVKAISGNLIELEDKFIPVNRLMKSEVINRLF